MQSNVTDHALVGASGEVYGVADIATELEEILVGDDSLFAGGEEKEGEEGGDATSNWGLYCNSGLARS